MTSINIHNFSVPGRRVWSCDVVGVHGSGHEQLAAQPDALLLPLPLPQDQEGHAQEGVILGERQQGMDVHVSDRYGLHFEFCQTILPMSTFKPNM